MAYEQADPLCLNLQPLTARESKFHVDEIRLNPQAPPPDPGPLEPQIRLIAEHIRSARRANAAVVLAYGAHLIKNGLGPLVSQLAEAGWITHLATNGAATIHDWEYAFQGCSEEDVRTNVSSGTFGAWNETGCHIHLAVLLGALQNMGYGESLGKFICEDGGEIPDRCELAASLAAWARAPSDDNLIPARAELLQAMVRFDLPVGFWATPHPHKEFSLTANAYRLRIPLTVHPGIGYDIIYNHHFANGAVLGRGADIDYRVFVNSIGQMDGGVFLSIGSAIMAPQIFEKALSFANNLRLQEGRDIIEPFIAVNDLAPVEWDWSRGEPPKDNPAYYHRFCKTFSRMGGKMIYAGGDNKVLLHNLYRELMQ